MTAAARWCAGATTPTACAGCARTPPSRAGREQCRTRAAEYRQHSARHGDRGTPYNFTFESFYLSPAGAYTLQSGSLPSGLTLNPGGTITGTPTSGGTFTATAQMTNGLSPVVTSTFSIVVSGTGPSTFSIDDVTLPEGDAGTQTFAFTITRSGDTSAASSVDWSTLDGSAVAPSDYTAVVATTVNCAAGETTETVSVTVNGDISIEANDGFTVNLANPVGSTIADGTGVGRITNDDAAAFSVNDVTVTEGDAGTTSATFTVSRTGATAGAATVQWRTLNLHATASDYVAVGVTTLSFAGGDVSETVSVTVNGDNEVEPTEDFYVRLSTPTGGHTIADATGVGTITNDDAAANSLSIGDATVLEGDSGSTTASFTVSRTGDTSEAATVQWFTVAGTATAGVDFVAVGPTMLTFVGGETSKPVCRSPSTATPPWRPTRPSRSAWARLWAPLSPMARRWDASPMTTPPPSRSTT